MGFTTNDSLRKYTTLLQRHTDLNGNNVCEEIKDELKQVIDREILLEQIPHPYLGISVVYSEKNPSTNIVTNTILKEIDMDETLTSFDQMKIDYNTGKIILHYTLEGKYLNVSYWGMGYNLIHSSRVYTKLDENLNVTQTLEDIIEKLRNINNAGYIVDTLQTLETEIGKLKVPLIDDDNIKTDKTYSNKKIEDRLSHEIKNHRHDVSEIDNLPSGGISDAKDIIYDNRNSKLISTKVQGAIDELVTKNNELVTKNNENKTSILNNGKLAQSALDKANEAFQSASNGKQLIAAAITGKGISASGNDTFSVLAGKIDGITVESLGGKRWAIGETVKTENVTFYYPSGSSGPGYIARINVKLDFEPSLVLCRIKNSKTSDGLYGKISMGYLSDGYLYSSAYRDLSTAIVENKKNMSMSSTQLAIPLGSSSTTTIYEWIAFE